MLYLQGQEAHPASMHGHKFSSKNTPSTKMLLLLWWVVDDSVTPGDIYANKLGLFPTPDHSEAESAVKFYPEAFQ